MILRYAICPLLLSIVVLSGCANTDHSETDKTKYKPVPEIVLKDKLAVLESRIKELELRVHDFEECSLTKTTEECSDPSSK